ncbi:amidohydrolase [Pseudomonas sichuanensis]|uniref:amidohydrolase n=1 Tax=Pseudomonas sichuanensis TaxID=2213015 RepID=UPI00244D57EB|nr:amidohydrolase [Pseudomonas sichuanensis]MDH0734100.1 amidohydrolase [Pseudomonas sichuanensis]MDH1586123.1 amidohydrolase [Pseudomonas sichuanensis]MDH1595681.1 amidohydrolase [Pseudomonas sichuanensis]MDH1600813.1 amidohydrolase [Pseudomonas sichuanensis]
MKQFLKIALGAGLACTALPGLAAVDLILHNAKVYTAAPDQPLQQAVAVDGEKIVAVGSDQAVLRLKTAGTQVIDLGGKLLMPGMLDSHSHAIKGGLQLELANLAGEQLPLDELERRLRQWRDNGKARRGEFLSVGGLPPTYWDDIPALEQRFNHGEWATQPILFAANDMHTGWANQAMLQRAGVNAASIAVLPEDARNTIGRHPDGTPNGFLVDASLYPVTDLLPPLSQDTLLTAGRMALDYYKQLGITGWMDPLANELPGADVHNDSLGVLPVYKALAENGELTAHVAALLMADSKAGPADLDELDKVRQQFIDVPNLTLPGIKVFADGVAEMPAQSAAMLEPYRNSGQRGELLLDPAHFGELVSAADARGWLVHVHAIGDRAVRVALDGIEQARHARHSGIAHSITHLQMVSPKEYARFRQLDVIASMQLYWASADEANLDLVKPYVSAMAFMHTFPAHSLLNNGATIAGASDWPISTPEPWKAIYQAITRKGPKGVLNAGEAIDLKTMLQAYTLNAARAMRLERQVGSLEVGKQADMIVLDRDVLSVSPQALRDTQVLQTWFAGKRIYAR